MGEHALLEDSIQQLIVSAESKLDGWSIKYGTLDAVKVLMNDYNDFYVKRNFPLLCDNVKAKTENFLTFHNVGNTKTG